jgi:prolipoprotein diacylglyceryl transferase
VTAHAVLLAIPSPGQGVWHLGPLPVRGYALCIILGVVAAVWFGEHRWEQRGGRRGEVADVALWAVPAGLVGARLYHVITDHDLYFGSGRDPVRALEIWHGGLAIWGAIAGGAFGAWLACRHLNIRMTAFIDALAPCLLLAQAIGRWGNYFNQELFGRPTDLPWKLHIDPAHRIAGYEDQAYYHPTFLYECLWNLGAMGLVLWLDRRLRLGFGRCFALYVMAYTAGRAWIEDLRIDVAADGVHPLGLRFNVWTSIVLFALAAAYFVLAGRRHPRPGTREDSPYRDGPAPGERSDDSASGSQPDADVDASAKPGPSGPAVDSARSGP